MQDLAIKCYILSYRKLQTALNESIFLENFSDFASRIYSHEHDLVCDENSSISVVTCCTCNIRYCNKCGKEIPQ
jgi:hypothetical protein